MKLRITVEEKTYEVEVEVAEPEVPASPVYSFQPAAAVRVPAAIAHPALSSAGPVNEDKVCRSPIAGIVVRVSAQPGQKIQTGDTLLVLEAMKMETNITAPVSGTISKVNVAQGDAVQGGQILVEFE